MEAWIKRMAAAKKSAHQALAIHESAPSRVVLLEDLSKHLSGAPIDVQDYFSEAIICVERKLYRSGIVLAWAGHFHVLCEGLLKTHQEELRVARPNWKFKDTTEFKEKNPEAQILVAAKDLRFISNAKLRILDGQLSLRNQCAHPTLYRPSLNEAVGYLDAMIRQTISYLPNE